MDTVRNRRAQALRDAKEEKSKSIDHCREGRGKKTPQMWEENHLSVIKNQKVAEGWNNQRKKGRETGDKPAEKTRFHSSPFGKSRFLESSRRCKGRTQNQRREVTENKKIKGKRSLKKDSM